MVKKWNKQAKKEDIIYHLGDFVNCNSSDPDSWEKAILLVKKIKAKVVLIIGNNEEKVITRYFGGNFDEFRKKLVEVGFFDVKKEDWVELLGQKFYLIHDPKEHKNDCLNLFGHMHRSIGIYKPYGFNMGVDLNHFALYGKQEIQMLLWQKKDYWDKDPSLLN